MKNIRKNFKLTPTDKDKCILDLEETINGLREQLALRYDLEDKIVELNTQIEKMKNCSNCDSTPPFDKNCDNCIRGGIKTKYVNWQLRR